MLPLVQSAVICCKNPTGLPSRRVSIKAHKGSSEPPSKLLPFKFTTTVVETRDGKVSVAINNCDPEDLPSITYAISPNWRGPPMEFVAL
jgi:hypothetical protein